MHVFDAQISNSNSQTETRHNREVQTKELRPKFDHSPEMLFFLKRQDKVKFVFCLSLFTRPISAAWQSVQYKIYPLSELKAESRGHLSLLCP